jgi:uncharacterized protein with PIN domain/sulfur carrier protein ThiS
MSFWHLLGEYTFNGPQSVKHLVEAAGVPHTEVSAFRINGAPASFDSQVQEGDQVEVLSFLDSLDIPQLGENGNGEQAAPRFILDNHLGKLASYLRMLGFDSLYNNAFQDEVLAQLSVSERRLLLTRDHRLLMRKIVTQGYWLRSQHPDIQLKEVVGRYSLAGLIKPFQRCMICNAELIPVPKEAIMDRLKPLTIRYFNEFRICPSCSQIYWQGSHFAKMLTFIEKIISTY